MTNTFMCTQVNGMFLFTPALLLQQTSAADVTDSDAKGEVRLVCLSLGFEQVVDRRFAYARPILLQQADRGLAGVGRQHLLYTEGNMETKMNVWGHRVSLRDRSAYPCARNLILKMIFSVLDNKMCCLLSCFLHPHSLHMSLLCFIWWEHLPQ